MPTPLAGSDGWPSGTTVRRAAEDHSMPGSSTRWRTGRPTVSPSGCATALAPFVLTSASPNLYRWAVREGGGVVLPSFAATADELGRPSRHDLGAASGATCGSHRAHSSRHSQASSGRVSAAQAPGLIRGAGVILSLFSPYKRGVAGSNAAAVTKKCQVRAHIDRHQDHLRNPRGSHPCKLACPEGADRAGAASSSLTTCRASSCSERLASRLPSASNQGEVVRSHGW